MLIAKWYETAMFRFKITFGATLSSRELSQQKTESLVKVRTLNKLRKIAAPACK